MRSIGTSGTCNAVATSCAPCTSRVVFSPFHLRVAMKIIIARTMVPTIARQSIFSSYVPTSLSLSLSHPQKKGDVWKWKDSQRVPNRNATIHRGANMTEHCEKLSRQRSLDIFGTQPYPICYTDDRETIKHIHCVIGPTSKYKNVVNADSIYYCYGSDGAHVSMRRAFEKQTAFPVKVTANGTPETYLWGYAVIHALLEIPVDEAVGKRYVLHRALQGVPERKRPHDDALEYDGQTFDSKLEIRHYMVMKELGFAPNRNVLPTHNNIILSDGRSHSYTPDLRIELPDEGCTLVEIKPCAPYVDERRKCMQLCLQSQRSVILLYNTTFAPPFVDAPLRVDGTAQLDYAHSTAITGYRYQFVRGKVEETYGVGYMAYEIDGSLVTTIGVMRDMDTKPYWHPVVLAAYEHSEL